MIDPDVLEAETPTPPRPERTKFRKDPDTDSHSRREATRMEQIARKRIRRTEDNIDV